MSLDPRLRHEVASEAQWFSHWLALDFRRRLDDCDLENVETALTKVGTCSHLQIRKSRCDTCLSSRALDSSGRALGSEVASAFRWASGVE